jgi:hypothetical protein
MPRVVFLARSASATVNVALVVVPQPFGVKVPSTLPLSVPVNLQAEDAGEPPDDEEEEEEEEDVPGAVVPPPPEQAEATTAKTMATQRERIIVFERSSGIHGAARAAQLRMRSASIKTVVLVSLPALALACGGGEERRPARAPTTGTTQTTSAALTVSSSPSTNATMTPAATAPVAPPRPVNVETASAVMRVTTARCDREAECSHVGTNKSFGDRDECVNEVGHYVVAALPSDQCPGGVDPDALSTCVRDVQAEPCAERGEGSAAAVDRLTSCSRERLCATPF